MNPEFASAARHALATLLHLAGGKTDERPVRQSLRDVDLDTDVVGVDAEDGGGANGGEHVARLRRASTAAITAPLPSSSRCRGDGSSARSTRLS